jgi:hypothetical protein
MDESYRYVDIDQPDHCGGNCQSVDDDYDCEHCECCCNCLSCSYARVG